MKKTRNRKGSAKKVKVVPALLNEFKADFNTPAEIKKHVKTVQDAWDAMKAAGELPRQYTSAKVPEYGSEEFYPEFRPLRSELVERTEKERADRKKGCPHKYENGRFAIAWQEHSQHIVMGVCKHCFSSFDIRNSEDKAIYDSPENLSNIKFMAHAGDHAQVKPPTPIIVPETTQWYKKLWTAIGVMYATRFRSQSVYSRTRKK